MKELLKNVGLTDEQITSVVAAMNEAKLYTTKEQNIEQRYTKLKTQKTDLESQIAAANTTIEELKQSNLTNVELQAQIEAHKQKVQEIETQAAEKVKNLTLDNAINAKLVDFDPKYHTLLKTAFNRDTLSIDSNGNVLGLDEQYNSIKDTYGDLAKPTITGATPANPTGGNKGVTKEAFAKMSYKEQLEIYNTNPTVYAELTQE